MTLILTPPPVPFSILPVPSLPRTTSNGSVDREGTPRPSSQPNPSPDQNLVKDIRPTNTPSPRAFSEPQQDGEEQPKEDDDIGEPEAKKIKTNVKAEPVQTNEQREPVLSPRPNSADSSSRSPGRLTLDVDLDTDVKSDDVKSDDVKSDDVKSDEGGVIKESSSPKSCK